MLTFLFGTLLGLLIAAGIAYPLLRDLKRGIGYNLCQLRKAKKILCEARKRNRVLYVALYNTVNKINVQKSTIDTMRGLYDDLMRKDFDYKSKDNNIYEVYNN